MESGSTHSRFVREHVFSCLSCRRSLFSEPHSTCFPNHQYVSLMTAYNTPRMCCEEPRVAGTAASTRMNLPLKTFDRFDDILINSCHSPGFLGSADCRSSRKSMSKVQSPGGCYSRFLRVTVFGCVRWLTSDVRLPISLHLVRLRPTGSGLTARLVYGVVGIQHLSACFHWHSLRMSWLTTCWLYTQVCIAEHIATRCSVTCPSPFVGKLSLLCASKIGDNVS